MTWTPDQILSDNAAALRALRAVAAQGHPPTAEQAEDLARWVGFSDPNAKRAAFGWDRSPRGELVGLLSREDGDAACGAADLSPPRVPPSLAAALWRVAAGLAGAAEGLRALDPCPGAGVVAVGLGGLGRPLAAVLAAPSPCPLSAAILRLRAPEVLPFPGRLPPSGTLFDLVVGAAPDRGGQAPEEDCRDLSCRYLSATRPGWYVARAVQALRPGGVAVLLVDRDFLDREDRKVREWVGARAELLGAARLPGEEVGREEALDVLVFRRRPWTANASGLPWMETRELSVVVGEGDWTETVRVNVLWDAPGATVLGRWGTRPGEYRPRLLPALLDIPTRLDGWAAERLPSPALAVDPPRIRRERIARRSDDPAEAMALDLVRAVRKAIAVQESGEGDPLPLVEAAARRYRTLVGMVGPLRAAEADRKHALRGMLTWPEWNLLRALEDPDGTPSRLLRGRALRGRPGNVSPADASEALARSLDRDGRPDVAKIAAELGLSEAEAEEALGDAVFRDPSGRGWRGAAEYLSGDVRGRLQEARSAAALDPRLQRNVAALERIAPRGPARVAESAASAGPDDVVVPLGAAWVPTTTVRDFAAHIVGARRTYGLDVVRVALTGVWSVRCQSPQMLRSVENVTTWGAPGMPALEILSSILNGKTPVVMRKEEDPDGGKDRDIRDEDATAAALGKADEIRTEWPRWIRTDPIREKTLLDAWAERFGGFVRRRFDGSYLSFPGLALVVNGRPFEPRRHQRTLVERIASRAEPDDSCLGVHRVGYGKTFSGIAGAVRRWQLGMSDLTLIVVPGGRVFGQWREAAGTFFPGAADQFLFGPDDWARDGSAFLRRIRDGECAFAVLTYEQFASIPPSAEMLREFLERELLDLREALFDAEASERKEEKRILKAALNARKKAADRHLESHGKRLEKLVERAAKAGQEFFTWEDVVGGASSLCLMFDEWQWLKRIPVPTRMERVHGLSRGESYRAVDGLAKVRRCLSHGGKAVGLTGTPITNTLAEGNVAQEFFQPERLRLSGIRNFDDWASTFAEPVVSVEMDAVGEFRPVTRLRLINLPELLELLGEVWDFASHVEEVKRPDLIGGQMRIVEVEGSSDLQEYVRELADRAEAIRAREVEPSEDNMLKVTSDGRRASVWNGRPGETFPRPPEAPEHEPGCPLWDRAEPAREKALMDAWEETEEWLEENYPPDACSCRPRRRTKLDAAADELWRVYADHFDDRGVSLVFLDLGTPKGEPGKDATEEERFRQQGLYGELKQRLLSRGVREDHVAFVHDAKNEAELANLFIRVNAGDIRILMGSTSKLGVGTNPQRRVVMVMHLDAPWRPDELIQRGGRGRRDGNLWNAIHEVAIVTSRSYDVCLWQLLQTKADFVAKFQEGDAAARVADDVGDLLITAGLAKAIALGNVRVLEKVRIETALTYMERQRRSWDAAKERAARDLEEIPARIARLRGEIAGTEAARASLSAREAEFRAELRDVRSPDRYVVKNVAEADARVYALSNTLRPVLCRPLPVGLYRGKVLRMEIKYGAVAIVMDLGGASVEVLNVHSTGTFAALDRELGMLDVRAAALKKSAEAEEAREAALRAEVARPWDRQAEAERLLREYDGLCTEVAGTSGLVDRRRFDL